jgi:hypothetical protein
MHAAHPVLFMLLILLDIDESDVAHNWLRLPPNLNEERELFMLDVRDDLFNEPGMSMRALME